MPGVIKKLYFTSRKDWRAWLKKHHNTGKEVWLVYYKKHTGKPRIPYDDAVEEALCFGWIDGQIKRIDDEKYVQRYTPRRDRSVWSEYNIKRARKMIKEGKMRDAGLIKLKEVFKDKKSRKNIYKKNVSMPPDLRKALIANKKAWANFKEFPISHQKMYFSWVDFAKKDETRQRRIKYTVKQAFLNKKPGIR